MNNFSKFGAAAALALTLVHTQASPLFRFDPNANGGVLTTHGQPFNATAMNGTSSHRITRTGTPLAAGSASYVSKGYAYFDSFSNNGTPVSVAHTRANLDYGLYGTFQTTFSCNSVLGPGVRCEITGFDLEMFADPGNDNAYHAASLTNDGWVSAIGQQYKLAYSSNAVHEGSGGLGLLGGAYVNLNFGWTLTNEGKAHFIDPVPFYSITPLRASNATLSIAATPKSSPFLPVAAFRISMAFPSRVPYSCWASAYSRSVRHVGANDLSPPAPAILSTPLT